MQQHVAPTLVISSLHSKINGQIIPHKKPRSEFSVFDIYELFGDAKVNGCQVAVIELSASNLARFVYEGLIFDAGVLTNLSHDHLNEDLNFHHYSKTHKEVFLNILRNKKLNKIAILPKDDKAGRQWFDELPFDKKTNYSSTSSAILKAYNVQRFLNGTTFDIDYLWRQLSIRTQLVGLFNVDNILAALGLAFQIGLDPNALIPTIESFSGLASRMSAIHHQDQHYYFDIAHSPDALDKTLQFLTHIKGNGRLIVMFSAPDFVQAQQRSHISTIVERYANIMIITEHYTGNAEKLVVLDDLSKELHSKQEWADLFIIPDRTLATQFALEIGQVHDVFLFTWSPNDMLIVKQFLKIQF